MKQNQRWGSETMLLLAYLNLILNIPVLLDFVLLFTVLESACPGTGPPQFTCEEPKPFSGIPSPSSGFGLDISM